MRPSTLHDLLVSLNLARLSTGHKMATYMPLVGHIQATYRQPSGHLQATFRPPTGNLQATT